MQIFANKKFENPIATIEAFDNKSFKEAFSKIEVFRKRPNTYLLGYIRYEAKEIFLGKKIESKYPLLYFEVYSHYELCRAKADQMSDFVRGKQSFDETIPNINNNISPTIDFVTYEKAINKIKEEIANGNTYEVNYTYDYKIGTESNNYGEFDGFNLYNSILPRQTTPYNAYIKNKYEEILSFSPELFFELESNKIKTKPMKGTVKRGETAEEDQKNIDFLKNDIKNRAENVMIVDLLRNDLGKIAKTGTVKVDKLFEVETHKTLHQMTSEISAELEENTTLYGIFDAIFPCGSITGAPKISTMQIIDKTEIDKREVYCGAIGLISPEKTVFSVPIRTLQKHNDEKDFLCRVGGAIVWDSTPEEEWEETQTKIKFISSNRCFNELSQNVVGLENPTYKNVHNYIKNLQLVETILVENGEMKYKTEHFDRMKKSADELGFVFNPDILNIKPQNDCMLRVLLNKDGSFKTQELQLKEIKTSKICISKTVINSNEPLLYHKTTYRPWYEESMVKIKQGLIFDEIFFNEKGELTEGARSNVILQINGKMYTPPIECGILNGVLRQVILKKTSVSLQIFKSDIKIYQNANADKMLKQVQHDVNCRIIEEKKLYLSDLKNAEKIFCINSVRGIIEVKITPPALEGEVCFQREQKRTLENRVGGQ